MGEENSLSFFRDEILTARRFRILLLEDQPFPDLKRNHTSGQYTHNSVNLWSAMQCPLCPIAPISIIRKFLKAQCSVFHQKKRRTKNCHILGVRLFPLLVNTTAVWRLFKSINMLCRMKPPPSIVLFLPGKRSWVGIHEIWFCRKMKEACPVSTMEHARPDVPLIHKPFPLVKTIHTFITPIGPITC